MQSCEFLLTLAGTARFEIPTLGDLISCACALARVKTLAYEGGIKPGMAFSYVLYVFAAGKSTRAGLLTFFS